MIKLDKITKRYGNNVLLDNVSVEFKAKKTKIKGENGIGKSVLLKIIVGYSIPDSGTVQYDNKALRKESDFIEDAGVSINAPEFMSNWTGKENLMYLQGIKKKCSTDRLWQLIRLFSLETDIKKKYRTYSLGMRQKMRLIQALMDEPQYLILDEPFDALDVKSKMIARDVIDDYLNADEKRMLIYTSHTEEDDSFADEVYLIENQKMKLLDI